jgi:hypothetical protein
MLPASFAACVPVFIATPTSAWASAGGHRDEVALRLLLADEAHLVLGRRLGEEVVDAGLGGDRRGGEAVVAGDHHGADAHAPQLVEALAHALLDDVLEVHHPERPVVLGDDEGRAAGPRDPLDDVGEPVHVAAAAPADEGLHRIGGALADRGPVHVDAAHAGLGAERHELVLAGDLLALAQREALLRQNDDRAALRRLVGEGGELRGLGELPLRDPGGGQELGRLAVADRDRAGLVEEEHVDVARRLDRAAGHRQHVALHEAVHPGDADGGEERADGRGDEGDEEGHE